MIAHFGLENNFQHKNNVQNKTPMNLQVSISMGMMGAIKNNSGMDT